MNKNKRTLPKSDFQYELINTLQKISALTSTHTILVSKIELLKYLNINDFK